MFRKIVIRIGDLGGWISGIALLVLMLVTVTGIILRTARIPTTNFYEIITLSALILFVSGWAYTQKHKGHLRVNILLSKLPQRIQSIVDVIVYLISLFLSCLMVRYCIGYAIKNFENGRVVSQNFELPIYVLVCIIIFFIALFCLMLIIDLIDSIVGLKKGEMIR